MKIDLSISPDIVAMMRAEFYSATIRKVDRFRGPVLLRDLHWIDLMTEASILPVNKRPALAVRLFSSN